MLSPLRIRKWIKLNYWVSWMKMNRCWRSPSENESCIHFSIKDESWTKCFLSLLLKWIMSKQRVNHLEMNPEDSQNVGLDIVHWIMVNRLTVSLFDDVSRGTAEFLVWKWIVIHDSWSSPRVNTWNQDELKEPFEK